MINTLCDNALFEAFLARSETVSADLVEKIGNGLGLHRGGDAHERVDEKRPAGGDQAARREDRSRRN